MALLALAGGLAGCGDDVIGPTGDGGQLSICELRQMDAGSVPRCTADDQCCDREACNMSTGICYALDECTVDADCQDNQKCLDEDQDGFRECVFQRCTDDSECTGLQCDPDKIATCSAGGCICGDPCQGGCADGQGCCVPEDQCYDLPAECEGMTCPLGQFVSVTNPGAWDTGRCQFLGEVCACEDLPFLPVGDIGLYSAMAFDGTTQVLSAYNITYGDLMYGTVQPDMSVAWEFVDGIPTTTTSITGNIDGPRGGNSDPGQDLGLHTDLVVDLEGKPHIAYHDRDRGALKYAVRTLAGWQIHSISASRTGGLYSSLTLNAAGLPILAFLTHQEDTPNTTEERQSVLRVAFAQNNNPAGTGDWLLLDVVTTNLTPFECSARCRVGEVCRASDNVCKQPDPSQCNTACGNNRACIDGQCTPTTDLPPYRDIPVARGLWPSVASLPDGTVLIAYYDSIATSLNIARIAGPDPTSGSITVTTIDGQTDDAGKFPSLFVTPAGEIHLAYMNETTRSLEYRNLDAQLNPLAAEQVATGIASGVVPGGSYVGADPALVVDANGVVRIAFQDSTLGLLRYAQRTGPNLWSIATLRGDEAMDEGSFGFYTDQVLDAQRLNPVVSTYRFFLSALPDPDNGVVVLTPP